MKLLQGILTFCFSICLFTPQAESLETALDLLPSWNEGPIKKKIIEFVDKISVPGNKDYIRPEDRIAVLDNDGTLWVEKPLYVQLVYMMDSATALIKKQPKLALQQPFKAILERDQNYLKNLSQEDLLKIIGNTLTGTTQAEFEKGVKAFFEKSKNSHFLALHSKMIYQPMLELINFLNNKEFKVYICSGGGIEFMRVVSEKFYGISPERVIGSSLQMQFTLKDNLPVLTFTREIVMPVNDKEGKPVNIQRYVGKKPIFAVGNSDGDLQMMQYTAPTKTTNSLVLILNHDDANREFAYDKGAEKILDNARKQGWGIISMKKDFKNIFPNEK